MNPLLPDLSAPLALPLTPAAPRGGAGIAMGAGEAGAFAALLSVVAEGEAVDAGTRAGAALRGAASPFALGFPEEGLLSEILPGEGLAEPVAEPGIGALLPPLPVRLPPPLAPAAQFPTRRSAPVSTEGTSVPPSGKTVPLCEARPAAEDTKPGPIPGESDGPGAALSAELAATSNAVAQVSPLQLLAGALLYDPVPVPVDKAPLEPVQPMLPDSRARVTAVTAEASAWPGSALGETARPPSPVRAAIPGGETTPTLPPSQPANAGILAQAAPMQPPLSMEPATSGQTPLSALQASAPVTPPASAPEPLAALLPAITSSSSPLPPCAPPSPASESELAPVLLATSSPTRSLHAISSAEPRAGTPRGQSLAPFPASPAPPTSQAAIALPQPEKWTALQSTAPEMPAQTDVVAAAALLPAPQALLGTVAASAITAPSAAVPAPAPAPIALRPASGRSPVASASAGDAIPPLPAPVADVQSQRALGSDAAAAPLPAPRFEPVPGAPSVPAAVPAPLIAATSGAPPMAAESHSRAPAEALASPALNTIIDHLDDLRDTQRAARPDIMLRHSEFGMVALRVEGGAAQDWRALLSSRDPGFVPAVQAALAERAVAAAAASGESALAFGQSQSGPSEQRYALSPGSSQGSSQPYLGHQSTGDEGRSSRSQDDRSAPREGTGAEPAAADAGGGEAASRKERLRGDRGLFA